MTETAPAPALPTHRVACRTDAVLLVAFGLVVAGSKLLLIAALGNATPFWDQWDGEAAGLYLPYLNGTLDAEQLFAAHNEHCIAVTRIYDLLLLEVAGEWDPRLQMVANALLHAAILTFYVWLLLPLVAAPRRLFVVAVAALVFALPLGWENTLAGFQSQFYFALLFSLGAIAALAGAPAFTRRWCFGLLSLGLAGLSMASGTLAVAVAIGLCALQQGVGVRDRTVREWAALGLLFGLGSVLFTCVPHVPEHDALRAASLWEFSGAIVELAALPYATVAGVVVMHAPLFWLGWRVLRDRPGRGHAAWIALGVGALVAAHIVSLAYGRGRHVMGSRYLDTVVLAYPIDLALLLLAADDNSRRRLVRVATMLWIGCFVAAIAAVGYYASLRGAIRRGALAEIQQQNVTAYLATGDRVHLDDKPPLHIPHPRPQRLVDLLARQEIRDLLPAEIRPSDADLTRGHARLAWHGALAPFAARAERAILLAGPAAMAIGLALLLVLSAQRLVMPVRARGAAD